MGGSLSNTTPARPAAWTPILALLLAAAIGGCAPDFAASPTAGRPFIAGGPSSARLDDTALVADDGTKLPLTSWLPVDPQGDPAPVRAVIVALHGFDDRKAAFEIPAGVWQHDGIATYAYDQRGFGANPDAGIWPGSHTLAQDLSAAIRAARKRHPGVPVYALGESMGGAVLLDAIGGATGAERSKPDGVILAAPAVWGRSTEPLIQRLALWVAIRLIPSTSFTGRGFGVQASDNIPMLRELSRDPLFLKESRVDLIYGLVDLMDEALGAGANDHLPTLLLYGAHDELIPPDAMRKLVAELPERTEGKQRFAYYRNGWHMLLRDLEYPAVAGDVADWITDHAAPLASGADKAADKFFDAGR